jgi:hypothetical protein
MPDIQLNNAAVEEQFKNIPTRFCHLTSVCKILKKKRKKKELSDMLHLKAGYSLIIFMKSFGRLKLFHFYLYHNMILYIKDK